MKKLLIGIVILASAYGCKKNNEDSKTPPKLITGRWTYVKDSINFYQNNQFKSSKVENYVGDYIQFNADGTGTDGSRNLTYSISGSTLNINFAAYTFGGVQYPAEAVSPTILELSDRKLYLYYNYISTGNNSIYATLSK